MDYSLLTHSSLSHSIPLGNQAQGVPPKLRRESLRFLILIVSLRLARTARGLLPPLLVITNLSLLIYRLLGRRRKLGDKP